jgi:hypothetical protein
MTIPMRAYWQLVGLLSLGTLAVSSGCTTARSTNTARTGLEQLLVSNAVDQAYDRMDFSNLRGRAVFVDEKYLDCVDKNYVAAALRQRVLWSGGRLAAKAEDADIVLEIASGGVGTDNTARVTAGSTVVESDQPEGHSQVVRDGVRRQGAPAVESGWPDAGSVGRQQVVRHGCGAVPGRKCA